MLAIQGGISLIGYPISTLVGGAVLKKWVGLGTPPSSFSVKSPGWIGAWWLGFLIGVVSLNLKGVLWVKASAI